MKSKPLKVLFWDIETSHMIGAHFGLYDQNINYTDILQEWYIISAAWKWQDQRAVESISIIDTPLAKTKFLAREPDDLIVVMKLHQVLGQADIIVGHNADQFDLKKFNARALFHGLDPIPPVKTIDTLKVAKKFFKCSSNRLDYLAQFLGLGAKMDTPKGLWMDVLKGRVDAVEKMVKYNKQDVIILQKVYERFLPYINNDVVRGKECACGSTHTQRAGWKITKTFKYPRYHCQKCGSWFSGGASERVYFSLPATASSRQSSNMVKLKDTPTESKTCQKNESTAARTGNTKSSTPATKPKKTAPAATPPAPSLKKKAKSTKTMGKTSTTKMGTRARTPKAT